ncbi:uncharacterized protein B0I36DRAFT_396241 [Microdochium trichocladiopsis]|uniref:Uncharacterized protein n=1 Tax=Microdochium trichocladiopsis TaxID=1682393 RepID=A0A9P8XSY5_9PEZI|nr:uncharacterized protein B0I36DRAFT_396241 [Microdochium trichocladiopsis]KAH7016187.1 hypothetical protein B0I36DRAFT_396241 [Microdochium trichocladiopsis]
MASKQSKLQFGNARGSKPAAAAQGTATSGPPPPAAGQQGEPVRYVRYASEAPSFTGQEVVPYERPRFGGPQAEDPPESSDPLPDDTSLASDALVPPPYLNRDHEIEEIIPEKKEEIITWLKRRDTSTVTIIPNHIAVSGEDEPWTILQYLA